MIGIVMTLTSCVKDFDLNPATTIVRYIINDSST